MEPKSMKNRFKIRSRFQSDFQILPGPFLIHFGSILGSLNPQKLCSRVGAVLFLRKSRFFDQMQLWIYFRSILNGLWDHFGNHFGTKIASKNRSKNQCDFGLILGGFWALPGIHVGTPSGCGMPPGRSHEAPRRSQDAPKMLPRRSRTPMRHPKRPQEGPRRLQARFWTIFR